MKKLLLLSTALAGVALMSAPADAAVKLNLGGFFRGYGVYADNDEVAGAATSLREADLRRDSEVFVSGENTLDNGLTVGFYSEVDLGTTMATDEVYAYFSGGWGRVNLGSEDAAAFLLQVSAPSADSNIDGSRAFIAALNPQLAQAGSTMMNTTAFGTAVDYQHADFRQADRLTYLTPKFNGFQAGVSWAPETGMNAVGNNIAGMALDQNGPLGAATVGAATGVIAGVTAADYEDMWEAAARWDGEFQGFGISLGAGYSTADLELSQTAAGAAAGATTQQFWINDGVDTWNGGVNVAFQGFSLGGGYKHSETSRITNADIADTNGTATGDIERETWVVGGAYDNGPWHVGASYLNQETNYDALIDVSVAADASDIVASTFEVEKFAVGGGYTFGPGMTFRGSVAWGEFDAPAAYLNAGNEQDNDFTQVAIGTDIKF